MQSAINRLIFGKNYRFIVEDEVYAGAEILQVLNSYPSSSEDFPDFEVHFLQRLANNCQPLAVDPVSFSRYEDSFSFDFGKVAARFYPGLTGPGKIEASIRVPPAGLKGILRRCRSMEFPSVFDDIVQIIHELILVPSVYFHSDLALVHAASIQKNDKAILFSGTGGVGKSSSILHFSTLDDYAFGSDDICVVSRTGEAFPNMAWPKIYAYNVVNERTKKLVMNNRNIINRVHFALRRMFGVSVRRKVAPLSMYKKVARSSCQVSEIIFLKRENVEAPKTSEVSVEDAAEMTINIMDSEYFIFHKLLYWDEYNSISMGIDPLLSMNQVRNSWRCVLNSCFENASASKISVPITSRYEDFRHLAEERVDGV